MEQTLLYLIVSFIVIEFIIDQYLDWLNSKSWTKEIPEELKGLYDEEKYNKAREYNKAKERFALITSTFSFLLILIMLFLNGFAKLDDYVHSITQHPIKMALLFFGILYIASDIIHLPFSIYNTFVIEERFGFNRTTVKTFILDKIKGYLLGAIIGGAIIALMIWFYLKTGEFFWLYAWIAISAITLFFTMFYTSWIVPLFNKLKPLEEGELRTAIENYCNKVNFSLKNIFVIDGSKRSTKANAYFSGIGAKKSIVLFDTLIKEHSVEELVGVLAHEVGHYKKKHITKSLVLGFLQMGIMLFILGWFINSPVLSKALGAERQSFHLGLVAFALLYSPISMLTGIAMNVFSRKNEYEADWYAAETFSPEPLITALKRLSVNHLSNLTPHPAYVFVHYSHPPLLKRLRALNKS